MKFAALFFAMLVAGIAAEPVRFVDSPISVPDARIQREPILVTIIKSLMDTMGDYLGEVDPWKLDKFEVGISIVDDAVDLFFGMESIKIKGFSDFKSQVDYVNGILSVDLEFRHVSFSIEKLNTFIGPVDLKGDIGFNLHGTTLNIEAELDLGSISLNSIKVTPKIGSASASGQLFFVGDDITDFVASYVYRLRDWLVRAAPRIGEILGAIIMGILG